LCGARTKGTELQVKINRFSRWTCPAPVFSLYNKSCRILEVHPMKSMYIYTTLIGPIGIAEQGGAITDVLLGHGLAIADSITEETPLIREAARQLESYLEGNRKAFDLPLAPQGTAFQKDVWNALLSIPCGETRSYGQIAAQIGRPTACRAVGMANHRNPISILIPCHRVIGAQGDLVGYGGGLELKEKLLNLEKGIALK
jgi:methylated-DNA-[protein]-cysteine S-methyltransferase